MASSEHWIEFWVRGTVRGQAVDEAVRVDLRFPCALYDEKPFSPYRIAKAAAVRKAKKRAGLHPCINAGLLQIDPHDWSDSVDALMAA